MQTRLRSLPVRRSVGALLIAFAASSLTPAAQAQFSNSAGADLIAAGEAFDEKLPQLATTPDGGFYVSWLAQDVGGSGPQGHDVYLQRFDAAGTPAWAAGGKLVADRDQSNASGYGLAVDATGNAVLAFRDDRVGPESITVTKISATGADLWGPTGVQVAGLGTSYPQVAGASDGHVYVSWRHFTGSRLQRLDATGASTWAAPLVLGAGGAEVQVVELKASDNGAALVAFTQQGFSGSAPLELWASKVSPAQLPLWSSPFLQLSGPGGIDAADPPAFVEDGNGGALFAWLALTPTSRAFVQHVDGTGQAAFAAGGLAVDTDASVTHTTVSPAFDPVEQEPFVGYTIRSTGPTMTGLRAQKLDLLGNRLWGANGKTLAPLGAQVRTAHGAESLHSGGVQGLVVISTFAPGGGQNVELQATRLDDDGVGLGPDVVMSNGHPPYPTVGTGRTSVGNVIALIASRSAFTTGDDVALQNVLPDGSLGGVPSVVQVLGGGVNPVALTAGTAPHIGTTWQLAVDKSADPGAPLTAVAVYLGASAPVPLPEGELLIDPTSQQLGFQLGSGPAGSNSHAFAIPALIDVVGLTVHLQAALVGGPGGTQLTNGLAATLGL